MPDLHAYAAGPGMLGYVVHGLLEDPEQRCLRAQAELLDVAQLHVHPHVVLLTEIKRVAADGLGEAVSLQVNGPQCEDAAPYLTYELTDGRPRLAQLRSGLVGFPAHEAFHQVELQGTERQRLGDTVV